MATSPGRYRKAAAIVDGANIYRGRRMLPNTAPRSDDVFVDAGYGATVHSIAYRYLGDMRLWWVVADFNGIIDPFDTIAYGTTLRLPSAARLWMETLS